MQPISVKLPGNTRRRLDAAASRRGVPRSELVRQAVERMLAEDAGFRPVVADLVADLVGTVDGPADLSTSPEHMAGFGR